MAAHNRGRQAVGIRAAYSQWRSVELHCAIGFMPSSSTSKVEAQKLVAGSDELKPALSLARGKITSCSLRSLADTACTCSYLAFLAPRTGAVFPLLKSLVANTLTFSFLGFFASRLPRRLSPLDILCPFRTAGQEGGVVAKSGLARLQPHLSVSAIWTVRRHRRAPALY